MNTVRKSIAAALSGLAAWGVTAHPDGIDGLEWWGLFGIFVSAFLVWLTPNEPETVDLNERLRGQGLWDDEPTTRDRGAVSWATVAPLVIAAVAVLYAFGKLPLDL